MEQMNLEWLRGAQSEVHLLVYKLSGTKSAEALEEYTGFTDARQIPAEVIPHLKKELESELRYMDMMGLQKYRERRTMEDKLMCYSTAIYQMRRKLREEDKLQGCCSWLEFRKALGEEIIAVPTVAIQKVQAQAEGSKDRDDEDDGTD